jgi:hypothetical protein
VVPSVNSKKYGFRSTIFPSASAFSQRRNRILNIGCQILRTLLLNTHELWFHQLPGPLPYTTFLREDAISQEGKESKGRSTQSVVLEPRGNNCLDVFWVGGDVARYTPQPQAYGRCDGDVRSKRFETMAAEIGLELNLQEVQCEGSFVRDSVEDGLATMLFCECCFELSYCEGPGA